MQAELLEAEAELTKTIQKWADDFCQTESWERLNVWWPDDLAAQMSKAAMQVVCASVHTQLWLPKNGG